LSKAFSASIEIIKLFLSLLLLICCIAYVEPPLHPWVEADFFLVNDLSDVLLDSVCHYFIEDFCINVHYRNWLIVLIFGDVLGFGMRVILAS
jgi:hypothetical protein